MSRHTITVPIAIGTAAIVATASVLVASNIVFTRHYLLVSETEGVPGLPARYWWLLGLVDVSLAATIAILVAFVVSNARQILLIRRQHSFVDGVTHELKSPLASLKLSVDTLAEAAVPPAVASRLLGQMRADVDRLQSFIVHLLEAGRLQNNERTVELQPVALGALIRRSVERAVERHNLDPGAVACDLPDPDVIAETDAVAVEIALMNVLDNAVKYSDERPVIELRLRRGPQTADIAVSDRGEGLAPRELGRVFNRFYRVARTDRPRPRGTGLGLFVSRGLLRALGGDLVAHSDGRGCGATFTVRIPNDGPR